VTVVVAEDALIVREGIIRVLELAADIDVVEACDDYDSTIECVDRLRPDVLVTDIRMPPTGTDEGIRAANELRGRHPGLGVVVLSQYVEPQWALDLLGHGTERRAYLLKERVADPDHLVAAVRAVADGGSIVDRRWSTH
jgi:DNA-binding NarL/FixJ family response regulator